MSPTMRFLSKLAIVYVVATLVLAAGAVSASEPAAWRHDPIWDDGNAEFATYEVTWPRYRQPFTGRATLVLVKEPWAPDLHVKADQPRANGFDVLKLNHLRDVPTGIYTYHQMASVFLRRDTAEVVKIASSSAEACGLTTAQLRDGKLTTHSYFDGQGDQATSWPAGSLPWEGLPALLRDYVIGEAPASLPVFTQLLTSRFGDLVAMPWKVKKQFVDKHEVAAGSFAAYEIELRRGNDIMTFVFDAELPHVMLEYRSSQGTSYELAKVERLPYWLKNRAGDESWYPPALRDGFPR